MAQDPNKVISITLGELEDFIATDHSETRAQLVSQIKNRQTKVIDSDIPHFLIPTPMVAPLGVAVNKAVFVQEVWDAFIKPRQESGEKQSNEERVLMAILRAVYAGLEKA